MNVVFFGVLALLFLGMVAMQIAGHRYGLRREDGDAAASSEGRRPSRRRCSRCSASWWRSPSRGRTPASTRGGSSSSRRPTPSAPRICASICFGRRTSRSCKTRCGATSTRAWRTTTSSSTSGRRRPSARRSDQLQQRDLDARRGRQRQGGRLARRAAGPAEPQRDVRRGDRALRGAADARAAGDLRPPRR